MQTTPILPRWAPPGLVKRPVRQSPTITGTGRQQHPDRCRYAQGRRNRRDRYQRKLARLIETKPAYEAYGKVQKALADGDTTIVKRLVKKAIAIEPREGHFHSLLGDIEQKNKRYKAALKYYDKAIALNDNFFYYHLQRGLVNERLNKKAASRRSLELLPTANASMVWGISHAGNAASTRPSSTTPGRRVTRVTSAKPPLAH
jgi:tetratricopeptide (TPR) repeat protein